MFLGQPGCPRCATVGRTSYRSADDQPARDAPGTPDICNRRHNGIGSHGMGKDKRGILVFEGTFAAGFATANHCRNLTISIIGTITPCPRPHNTARKSMFFTRPTITVSHALLGCSALVFWATGYCLADAWLLFSCAARVIRTGCGSKQGCAEYFFGIPDPAAGQVSEFP